MGLRVNGTVFPAPASSAPTGTGYPHVTDGAADAAAQSASTVRAALDATRRTVHGTAGWTEVAGAGSVAVVSGAHELTIPAATLGRHRLGEYDAPLIRRPLTAPGGAVDLRVRLAAVTGTPNGSSTFSVCLENWDGATLRRLIGSRFHFGSTGIPSLLEDSKNGASPLSYDGVTYLPLDGTGWVRLVADRAGYHLFIGVGAGTGGEIEPTVWLLVASISSSAAWTAPWYPPTHVSLVAAQYDTGAGEWTVRLGGLIETTLAEV